MCILERPCKCSVHVSNEECVRGRWGWLGRSINIFETFSDRASPRAANSCEAGIPTGSRLTGILRVWSNVHVDAMVASEAITAGR